MIYIRIGIFDSGIGGITVLKELLNKYPNNEYIYYGDIKNLPYGEKTKEELLKLGKNIIEFLEKENVELIIIACGTCSSLVDEYRRMTKIPIIDVITPTVEYVKNNYKKVGLIATNSTITNGTFKRKLQDNGNMMVDVSCPSFVPYIEKIEEYLNIEELSLLKEQSLDIVILGCTHYPLIKEKIEEYLNIKTINMGKCLVNKINLKSGIKSKITIYLSKEKENSKKMIEEILERKIDIINLEEKRENN